MSVLALQILEVGDDELLVRDLLSSTGEAEGVNPTIVYGRGAICAYVTCGCRRVLSAVTSHDDDLLEGFRKITK